MIKHNSMKYPQVTVEATLEHPFFVFRRGWSSCSVSRTLARYGLDCQKLCVGDRCISLTQKDVDMKAAEISQQQQREQQHQQSGGSPGSMGPPSPHTGLPSTAVCQTGNPTHNSHPASTTSGMPASSHTSHSPAAAVVKTDKQEFAPPSPLRTSPLRSSPVATPVSRRRSSQNELPPPKSNVVPVKKENNSHHSRHNIRGSVYNGEGGQGKEKDATSSIKEENEDESPSSAIPPLIHQKRQQWASSESPSVKMENDNRLQQPPRAKDVTPKSEDDSNSVGDNGR